MAFPISLDDFIARTDNDDDVMAVDVNDLQTAIEALEAKLGIDGSAELSSIDYLVKVAVNPGHTHSWTVDNPTGEKNGSNLLFSLVSTPISGSLFVFLNGQYLTEGVDYSISGSDITMVNAPFAEDVLTCKYQDNLV